MPYDHRCNSETSSNLSMVEHGLSESAGDKIAKESGLSGNLSDLSVESEPELPSYSKGSRKAAKAARQLPPFITKAAKMPKERDVPKFKEEEQNPEAHLARLMELMSQWSITRQQDKLQVLLMSLRTGTKNQIRTFLTDEERTYEAVADLLVRNFTQNLLEGPGQSSGSKTGRIRRRIRQKSAGNSRT